MVNFQISFCMRIERLKDIGGEVGNLERMKDGTNKMRDMSKRPN